MKKYLFSEPCSDQSTPSAIFWNVISGNNQFFNKMVLEESNLSEVLMDEKRKSLE